MRISVRGCHSAQDHLQDINLVRIFPLCTGTYLYAFNPEQIQKKHEDKSVMNANRAKSYFYIKDESEAIKQFENIFKKTYYLE